MGDDNQSGFQLTRTSITVEGVSDAIIFSNLIVNQYLADVNDFSFVWRQEQAQVNLSGHVSFYQRTLSKEVTITIQDGLSFKGIVYAINCINQDNLGVEYEITGKGMFIKLDEVPECNSFYKKSLTDIFNALNTAQGTQLTLNPNYTDPLFYSVQYNQTTFGFYKMMAIRNGEWLYYNGTAMVLGNPDTEAISLTTDVDVTEVTINAKVRRAPSQNSGFDIYRGEAIQSHPQTAQQSAGLIAASTGAGNTLFGDNHTNVHSAHAANTDVLDRQNHLGQQAAAASGVYISANSHNSQLKLGAKIKILDGSGGSAGEYFIIEIHHSCIASSNYQNHFIAVPAEVEVPPYTDPSLFPESRSQAGLVVDNEDNDGMDRIKVHFPWQQQAENSPWISVVTPHAGKDKGIRFLPEVGEEVLVNFIDNNAEKPFVLGAVHTERNKSGNVVTGNNLKVIGSKSGRRLEIDDKAGKLKLYDNYTEKTPKNGVLMERTDSNTRLTIESQKDASNYSVIVLDNETDLNLGLVSGGSLIAEIRLQKDSKKITIHAQETIELNASTINLNGDNITIKASQQLKMEGTATGVNLKGQKVALDATTTMDIKGLNTTVAGSAQLDLQSSGVASLAGSLVKIN